MRNSWMVICPVDNLKVERFLTVYAASADKQSYFITTLDIESISHSSIQITICYQDCSYSI